MKHDLSEFSFGFAVTNELIQAPGFAITAAPVFPSLKDEGKSGGGYDVKLDRPGVPLFLQFKLSDVLRRKNAKEAAELGVPYYRMHIRSARYSAQHSMLHDLEDSGEEVFYVAPAFHTVAELNAAFLSKSVCARCRWTKPSEIGRFNDFKEHYFSFLLSGPRVVRSEPRLLGDGRGYKEVLADVHTAILERGTGRLSESSLHGLAEKIDGIVRKRRPLEHPEPRLSEEASTRSALEQVAYLSSMFLETQLFLAYATPT